METKDESVLVYNDSFEVTPAVKAAFEENGYVLIRELFDQNEMTKLREAVENDDGIAKYAYKLDDGCGKKVRMCLWKYPGNDITGMVARCEKVASTSEQLLGGRVSHFHTKMMMKDAAVGGQHVWHQDYGYWYDNGFLNPDMLTVFISLDPCTTRNGCLQVLKSSHKCGRLDHVYVGSQRQAEPVHVKELEKILPLVNVEMQPGDALFFHSNVLHRSGSNESPVRRWAFLCAFTRMTNLPASAFCDVSTFWGSQKFLPVEKVPNTAVAECTNITDTSGKDFLNPADDHLVKWEK